MGWAGWLAGWLAGLQEGANQRGKSFRTLRLRPAGWGPQPTSLVGPHMLFLQAEKVVQLVLSTVLKAYKVMHRRRTAAGPPDLHSSGAALVHGTLASKKSCMGGVPQPVRAGAPDLHSNGTALMHDFISLLMGFL